MKPPKPLKMKTRGEGVHCHGWLGLPRRRSAGRGGRAGLRRRRRSEAQPGRRRGEGLPRLPLDPAPVAEKKNGVPKENIRAAHLPPPSSRAPRLRRGRPQRQARVARRGVVVRLGGRRDGGKGGGFR